MAIPGIMLPNDPPICSLSTGATNFPETHLYLRLSIKIEGAGANAGPLNHIQQSTYL
jgi:hypothetical protein